MYDADTDLSGPLFNGQADAALDAFAEAGALAVADQAVLDIRDRLDDVLVNPTGFYSSRIASTAQGEYAEVWDSNVVYGNWLERGRPGTRFKGYATFRRVLGDLDRRAAGIAERELPEYLRRMQ